jgi:DNA repair exonuclease SbcCD nuclease subunit
VLKQWLRELPDPLMTARLRAEFLKAARNEDVRLRHIRLHEQVNDLPDANYATVRYFMGHLHQCVHTCSRYMRADAYRASGSRSTRRTTR